MESEQAEVLHQGWLTKSPPLETRKQLFNQSLITPVSTPAGCKYSSLYLYRALFTGWLILLATPKFPYVLESRKKTES
jgi:hypothetical protein